MSMGTNQKLQYLRDIAANKKIIVIDPEGEYQNLSRALLREQDNILNAKSGKQEVLADETK